MSRWMPGLAACLTAGGFSFLAPSLAAAQAPVCQRVINANVVAVDQVLVFNREGAFDPVGMVYALRRDVEPISPAHPLGPGNARLRAGKRPRPLVLRMNVGDCLQVTFTNMLLSDRAQLGNFGADAPATRRASFHVDGLHPLNIDAEGFNVGNNASPLARPGQTRVYQYYADVEGTFLAYSGGAVAGGEGDGGSLTHGLFGAVNVEPVDAVWYRSQVTPEVLQAATQGVNPDGTPVLDYDAVDEAGVPLLRMLDDANELVHADVNALVSGYSVTTIGAPSSLDQGHFRELTTIFHDELKAVQAFPDLDEPLYHGVRDGFGINYGSSGVGSRLLANRRRIGPARDCWDCQFEEFFLESWPNGDPALNVERDANGDAVGVLFPDDPSNVHHSYLGDPVRIRNLHAGPKETHVFHLHAHQWLHSPSSDKSTYLDSQTISPGSTFTYDINYGGSGNRNLTPGDAIFHCHLYPHFAQGMWELWRVHDVFEGGTPDRNLPDHEIVGGTPNPGVVPLPERGMPPLPTYEETVVDVGGAPHLRPAMPGYPFTLAGVPGHRAPQPAMDLAHDGGLPRHVMTSVDPADVVLGEDGVFDVDIHRANIKLLPADGTPAEVAGQAFHAGQFPGGTPRDSLYGWRGTAYPAYTALGEPAEFLVNGRPPVAGAPLADPCPAGTPVRNYRAAYVQIDAAFNNAGWHDPQFRFPVLEEDVDATRAGTRPPEPFFFRARSGECIRFEATNLMPEALAEDDFQVYTPTDTVGQHIHLVKFDVTASDGSGNGWNYEDGTFAPTDVQERIAAANAAGGAFVADGSLGETGDRVLLQARPHPRIASAPLGTQTTVQRWWADPLHDAGGADRTLNTVFTHDHFGPSSHQQHGFYAGLIIEPAGSTWRDSKTGVAYGTRPDGGPTHWYADVLTANPADSFREFSLAVADFALPYDAAGRAVNPGTLKREAPLPTAVEIDYAAGPRPEAISAADPGVMTMNYRNEPTPLRLATRNADGSYTQKAGLPGDPANLFRSDVHGDPATPLLRGYDGDKALVRLIQGAQEEQHAFTMHGQKWLHEAREPDSGYSNGQAIGISEHFEFEIGGGAPGTKNARGWSDYLYGSVNTDDLWSGTWGIFRSYATALADLVVLPNNAAPATITRLASPCPAAAPNRSYNVTAIQAKGNLPGDRLVYNEAYDLYDPNAILFVRNEHLAGLKAGTRRPEPLILRAAAGECITLKLTNRLPAALERAPGWNTVPPIVQHFNQNEVRPSNQVGLHPQLVHMDVTKNNGANVGYNEVQTVAPGASRTYKWYAGQWLHPNGDAKKRSAQAVEFGAVNLTDYGDVVTHGARGAVGALIIEPTGATWVADAGTEAQATVTYTDPAGVRRSFRDFVVVYQDELALHSGDPQFQCADSAHADADVLPAAQLNCGTAIRPMGGEDDAEDSGSKAFNYRTEPFWARLGINPGHTIQGLNDTDLTSVMSSQVFGDPETPVLVARVGQSVRIRVLQPSGHARQHAFSVHGHPFYHEPWVAGSGSRVMGANAESTVLGTQGGHTVARAFNVVPTAPAGGPFGVVGDFLYREHSSFQWAAGLWGILRVTP